VPKDIANENVSDALGFSIGDAGMTIEIWIELVGQWRELFHRCLYDASEVRTM
jgi:hypothetical protein